MERKGRGGWKGKGRRVEGEGEKGRRMKRKGRRGRKEGEEDGRREERTWW